MGSWFGGGSQQPTQTTTSQVELAPEQREILKLAMPGIRDWSANVPQRYQGSTVAGFDPSQTAGQKMVLDAAGAQAGVAGNAANTQNFWTSGNVWDPANNPALKGAVDAAVRPITERFQESVLPGIQGEAMQAGQQFGGSRRGIAEGIASRDYMRQVGDTSAKLVNDAYDTNVDAQMKALGLTGQTQQAQLAPGLATSGVGDVRQQMGQNLINEQVQNWNYDQNAPFLQSKELLSLLMGIPGGGSTSTSTASQPQANPAMQAVGLGMQLLPFLMS